MEKEIKYSEKKILFIVYLEFETIDIQKLIFEEVP